ncbi:MAG: TerB family tellurite resistance protein [Isosphaeraceae bacterium]|nr:TerB family tellurite resistance protein [Isosphaeraceae bacterium]
MIIFGTRGVTFGGRAGEFHCPGCGWTSQPYEHKTVRRFFTLYFIPVIPLDKIGEYVKCMTCGGMYQTDVLQFDPKAETERMRAEFAKHIRCLTVLTALIEGDPNRSRLDALKRVNEEVSGAAFGAVEVERELSLARKGSLDLGSYAKQHLENMTDLGKETVVRAVLAVAMADGGLSAREETEIGDLVRALGMTSAHYRGVLAEVEEEGEWLTHEQDDWRETD